MRSRRKKWWRHPAHSGGGTMEVAGREGEDYREDEEGESYNMGECIIKLCTLIDLTAENKRCIVDHLWSGPSEQWPFLIR